MVERYLAGRRNGSGAAVAAHDAGLAGAGDADEGPEGPPFQAGPGIAAG
jgi:hypothetical protein